MEYDAIVAGAGIWGCTVARRLAEAGHKVMVLEKRVAIGGNCRCVIDPETGIEEHLFGSHIFHTSNKEVWRFVNRFTKFNNYRHCVYANHFGKPYHLPIGCTLLKEFFGRDLKPSELSADEKKAIFDAFIKGYTSKQWGVPPEQVDPSVIARLKVRDSYSTDYFDDPYQGIPIDGYNTMFERMLDHANIEVRCNSPFVLSDIQQGKSLARSIYYSGPVDALFNFKFGALPWRTLRFEREVLPVSDFQGNSVVNYTDVGVPYTRIHEFRHYHPEWHGDNSKTIVTREYSKSWTDGDEPYYPINAPASTELLAKYQEAVAQFNGSQDTRLVVGGRLGDYRYYDMDQSVMAALSIAVV